MRQIVFTLLFFFISATLFAQGLQRTVAGNGRIVNYTPIGGSSTEFTFIILYDDETTYSTVEDIQVGDKIVDCNCYLYTIQGINTQSDGILNVNVVVNGTGYPSTCQAGIFSPTTAKSLPSVASGLSDPMRSCLWQHLVQTIDDQLGAADPTDLNSLIDVAITSPVQQNDILLYNGLYWQDFPLSLEFFNDSLLAIPGVDTTVILIPAKLNDLEDVDTSGIQVSDFLQWSGTAWVPQPVPPDYLNSLPDVDTAGIVISDLLQWNGTSWVMKSPLEIVNEAGAPTGSGTANQLTYWDTDTTITAANITYSPTILDASGLTGALVLPSGTDAQDPIWQNGMLRYNTTTGGFQGYNGAERYLPWSNSPSFATDYIPYSNGSNLTSSSNLRFNGTSFQVNSATEIVANFGNGDNANRYITIGGLTSSGNRAAFGYGNNAAFLASGGGKNVEIRQGSYTGAATIFLSGTEARIMRPLYINSQASGDEYFSLVQGTAGATITSADPGGDGTSRFLDFVVIDGSNPASNDFGTRTYVNNVLVVKHTEENSTFGLYGNNTITGTPSTWSAWDANGRFIETTAADIVAAGGAGNVSGSGVSGQVAYWSGDTLAGNAGFTHSATVSPSWIFRPPGLASNDPRITISTNNISSSYIDIAGGSPSWDSQIRWLTGGVASGVTWSLGNDGNASNNNLVLRNEFRAKDAVVFSNASTPTYTFDMWNYGDYIFNNGDFGIGRTPSYRLDVNTGGLRLTPQATDIVQAQGALYYDTDGNGFRGGDGSNLYYLPWIDDPSPAANRIPYSDGSKLTTSGNLYYDGDIRISSGGLRLNSSSEGVIGPTGVEGLVFSTSNPKVRFNLHSGGNATYARFTENDGSPVYADIGSTSYSHRSGGNVDIAFRSVLQGTSGDTYLAGRNGGSSSLNAGHLYICGGDGVNSSTAGDLIMQGGTLIDSGSSTLGTTGRVIIQTFPDSGNSPSAPYTAKSHIIFSGRNNRTTTQLYNLYETPGTLSDRVLVMHGDTIKYSYHDDIVTLGTATGLQFTTLASPPIGAVGKMYANTTGDFFIHDGATWNQLVTSGDTLIYTSGLTKTGSTVSLGGNITAGTTIGGNYTLSVTGSVAGTSKFQVVNSSGSGFALTASGGNYGVYAAGASTAAVYGFGGAYPLLGSASGTVDSITMAGLALQRGNAYVGKPGNGVYITGWGRDGGQGLREIGRLEFIVADTSDNQIDGKFAFRLASNAVITTVGTLTHEGVLQLSGGVIDNVETEVSSTTTATLYSTLPVDVSGSAVSITVPSSPMAGQWFAVVDSRGNAGTNNITVNFTGATVNFHGSSQDYTLSTNNEYARFTYVNSTVGWVKSN
jgi:hypothetical protein